MKKKIITLFLFGISFNGNCQYFEGYIVTKGNDTISCKFHNISNMFWKHIFNPATLRDNVKILNEKGEKTKYKPSELVGFVIKTSKMLKAK